MKRNLFCYSLFKSVPSILQPTVYNRGSYCGNYHIAPQVRENAHRAQGRDVRFTNTYDVLRSFSDMTEIVDSDLNTFLMMSNDTTHEPTLLQKPGYELSEFVDNTEYDGEYADGYTVNGRTLKMETIPQITHYHVNMAAMIQLGNWFDYLREMGVYDNTRIILVADHGRNLNQFDDIFNVEGIEENLMYFNPLLMVKDFDSREFVQDDSFMTNADTPSLAFEGLIEDPVNPFTGNPVNSSPKLNGEQYISTSHVWDLASNCGYTFVPDGWISVHDNIFDADNWKLISPNINK